MSADDTGRRPRFAADDVARAAGMRKHPRPGSAPVVSPVIEDDVTPLPQEPPDISQIDGFEDMPPTVQRAFLTLHNVQREHDVTFAKLWPSRHVHEEIAQIHTLLDGYRPYFQYIENLHTGLDEYGKRLHRVAVWIEGRRDTDLKLDRTLEALDKRLDSVEGDFRTMNATIATLGKDIAEGFRRRDLELEAFKAEVAKRFEKIEAEHKGEREKSEARIRSLEDSRTAQNAKLAAIGAVIMALAWLVNHLWK